MLFRRILTSSVFAPLVIFAVINLEKTGFSIAIAIFLIIALWEFSTLSKIKNMAFKSGYIFLVIAITYFLSKDPSVLVPVLIASLIWWLIAFYWVVVFPKNSNYIHENLSARLLIGLFLFIPMSLSLMALHINNSSLVLLLFGLIWASDVGAYFSGVAFGKTKLSPNVSPKKTIEGLFGGIVLALVIAFSYVVISNDNPSTNDYLTFGAISIITSLVSLLGDLFESLLKRLANVKDSGKILPGHGGMLDRIDSLTSSAPVFYLLLTYLV